MESSSWEIGKVLGQDPKGGDGVTAEAGTRVTVTVGGGSSIPEMPDLRAPHPEETTQKLGDGPGIAHDRESEGRNVEQRPPAGTQVEPDDRRGTPTNPDQNRQRFRTSWAATPRRV